MGLNWKYIGPTMGKWIGIPLLGVLIPVLSGLINNSLYGPVELILSYAWFILTSFTIWKGNEILHIHIRRTQRSRYNLVSLITILLLTNILYSCIIALLFLSSWQFWIGHIKDKDALVIAVLLSTNMAIIIASIYEIVFLNAERESDQLLMAKLDKEKIMAELAVLKSQIDPHFMFNSLNTLSMLIESDPQTARRFNDNLAKVYRYILGHKNKNLVGLQDEVEFVRSYFYLLKLRFTEGLSLNINLGEGVPEGYMIPPISLQTLVENAIKHNSFSESAPLIIEVNIDTEDLIICNNYQQKEYPLLSSGIGLQNLNSRYFLLTRKTIQIIQNQDLFQVRLPLIKAYAC